MPNIDRASFTARMQGKTLREADLRTTYPGVDVRGLANAQGIIEGTPGNLEKLWLAIDMFDRDGSYGTISGQHPLQIIEWVLARAVAAPVSPPPGGGPGNVPEAGSWQRVAAAGDRAITARTRAHRDAIDATGIGRYYGDHSTFRASVMANDRSTVKARVEAWTGGQWTLAGISRAQIDIRGPNGQTAAVRESSCIGWVMEHTKAAYEGGGKAARFSQMEQRMREADQRGTVLCEELQMDGWTAVFYSPRTAADLRDAGAHEKLGALNIAKAGSRIWRAVTVAGSRGVKCDVVVTGYRDSVPDTATQSLLSRLEGAPFFVGVANGGMHTFVGHQGLVADFHWTANPDDKTAMTEQSLREWEWDTGLYMVPPGFWSASANM